MAESAAEHVASALAVAVAVETLDAVGQLLGQFLSRNAEARARSTGVVEQRLHLGVARVHPQSEAKARIGQPCTLVVALVLRERIEGEVRRQACYLLHLVVGVGWRISVGRRAELLCCEACLEERAGSGGIDVLAEDGKRLPQGERLERKNNLYTGPFGHRCNEPQVAAQQLFLYHVAGRGQLVYGFSGYHLSEALLQKYEKTAAYGSYAAEKRTADASRESNMAHIGR